MFPRMTRGRVAIIALIVIAAAAYGAWRWSEGTKHEASAATRANAEVSKTAPAPAPTKDTVDLSDSQLASVKVEPIEDRDFPQEKEAVGSIDFNEDMSVQVFTPYQGRIIGLFASVGDDVKKGQTLFTIDSPDLLQAEFYSHRRGGRSRADDTEPDPAARAL